MKKQAITTLITAMILTVMFIPAALADSCCPSEREAKIDHKSEVNGYQMEYQFIDMKEKMKDMGHQMPGMTATHHLMVFIKNAQGEIVPADKVGFLIAGPDGKEQKAMAMGMNGGYGADITLSQAGEYSVKTKALAGGQTLIDSFAYTVK